MLTNGTRLIFKYSKDLNYFVEIITILFSGPAFIAAIISLLANLSLIGGAKQFSKEIVLFWIVWKYLLLVLFWSWFTYSKLKEWSNNNSYLTSLSLLL